MIMVFGVVPFVGLHMGKNRSAILNFLIKKYGYLSYLEIGLFKGDTFKKIKCPLKHSVDIDSEYAQPTYLMSSDSFFSLYKNNKYDIIFIDGEHSEDQTTKDILNSLSVLNRGGTIVVHDCDPMENMRTENHRFIRNLREKIEGAVYEKGEIHVEWDSMEIFCIFKDDPFRFIYGSRGRRFQMWGRNY